MTRAALGLRARTGWAAAVALGGSAPAPVALGRWRLELIPPELPRQAYHAARDLELGEAQALVARTKVAAGRTARRAVARLVAEMRTAGHDIAGVGLVLGNPHPSLPLRRILSSHASLHAAEGELYRDALLDAAGRTGLPVTGVPEREVPATGAATLALTEDELRRRLTELGRPLGAPWTQDQKLAALVAWLAL